jgi:hypothetical protein
MNSEAEAGRSGRIPVVGERLERFFGGAAHYDLLRREPSDKNLFPRRIVNDSIADLAYG